jgi:hypothetical protein
MGNSVVLDPMDLFRLTAGTGLSAEALLADKIELNVVDGIILPNLKMSGGSETCAFLNEEGRCSIHPYRPGICRLFPLGRYYETVDVPKSAPDSKKTGAEHFKSAHIDEKHMGTVDSAAEHTDTEHSATDKVRTFRYFLQVHECPAPNKTKVRVGKWIDTPDLVRYERFVNDWHYFLEDVQERLKDEDDTVIKNANLFLLKLFYLNPYDVDGDFYPQFEQRLARAREVLF